MAKLLRGFWILLFGSACAEESAVAKVTTNFTPDGCDKAHKAEKGLAVALILKGFIEDSGVPFTEYNQGQKMETVLGHDPKLKGLHQGIEGMCVGEKRTITVPPELGHGDDHFRADYTTIPPNSTLRFEVELDAMGTGVWHEDGMPVNIFKKIDEDEDGKVTETEFMQWFKAHGQEPPEGLFKEEDKNGDGFVTRDEFTGPKGAEEL